MLKICYLCSRHFYLFSVTTINHKKGFLRETFLKIGTNLLEDFSGTVLKSMRILPLGLLKFYMVEGFGIIFFETLFQLETLRSK